LLHLALDPRWTTPDGAKVADGDAVVVAVEVAVVAPSEASQAAVESADADAEPAQG
jgi:hypothetical protein